MVSLEEDGEEKVWAPAALGLPVFTLPTPHRPLCLGAALSQPGRTPAPRAGVGPINRLQSNTAGSIAVPLGTCRKNR